VTGLLYTYWYNTVFRKDSYSFATINRTIINENREKKSRNNKKNSLIAVKLLQSIFASFIRCVTRLKNFDDYNATECLTKLTNKRRVLLRTEVSCCQVVNAGTESPTWCGANVNLYEILVAICLREGSYHSSHCTLSDLALN